MKEKNERVYVCPEPGCKKEFTNLPSLSSHRRVHSDWISQTLYEKRKEIEKVFTESDGERRKETRYYSPESDNNNSSNSNDDEVEGMEDSEKEGCCNRVQTSDFNWSLSEPQNRNNKDEEKADLSQKDSELSEERLYNMSNQIQNMTFKDSVAVQVVGVDGTRLFRCPVEWCSRNFTQLGNLKTHMRTHTGERGYICPLVGCRRTFTAPNSVKRHIKRSHPKLFSLLETKERGYFAKQTMVNAPLIESNNHNEFFVVENTSPSSHSHSKQLKFIPFEREEKINVNNQKVQTVTENQPSKILIQSLLN